jgi:hypothetical protein
MTQIISMRLGGLPRAPVISPVAIEKPGFQTFAVTVDVRQGETTTLNVSLIP